MSEQNPGDDRFLVVFETWAEYLPDTPFDFKIIGSSDEYRLRPSVEGTPYAEGLPQATDALGSNISDLEVLAELEDFYIQGFVVEASLVSPDIKAAGGSILIEFPDAKIHSKHPSVMELGSEIIALKDSASTSP